MIVIAEHVLSTHVLCEYLQRQIATSIYGNRAPSNSIFVLLL